MSIDMTQHTLAEYVELKAMMSDLTLPTDTPTQPVTQTSKPIADYQPELESWKEDLRANDLSPATRNSYEIHVNAFFAHHGNENLHSVKVGDVIDYKDYLLKKRNLRPATVNLKRIALKRFFQFCVDSKVLESNPMATVKKVYEEPLPPSTPSESDVNKMRNHIRLNCEKRNDYNHLLLFDFMKTLGLRISEAIALTFKDIDIDERVLTIRYSKGNKTRYVPIPDDLMESYKQFASNLHRSSNKHQFIFMYRGKEYAEASVRSFYHRIKKVAGVNKFSPHSLRHYFCKTQIESGTPLTHVAKICGHSSIEITAKYAEPNLDDLRVSLNR